MKPSSSRAKPVALVTLALVGLLGSSACGIRTEPRPPEMTMPERPESLTAIIENDEVRLRWTRPKQAVDGQTLYDLAGFIIERRSDESEFAVIAEVQVNDRERVRPQNTFKWRDLDPIEGRSFYRVRAYTEDGQTGAVTPGIPIVVDPEIVANAARLRDAAAAADAQETPRADGDTRETPRADGDTQETPRADGEK